jgi:hypothetical protein
MDGFSFVVMENATNFLGPFYEAQSAGPDTRLDGLLLKLKLGLKCLKLQKSYLSIKNQNFAHLPSYLDPSSYSDGVLLSCQQGEFPSSSLITKIIGPNFTANPPFLQGFQSQAFEIQPIQPLLDFQFLK